MVTLLSDQSEKDYQKCGNFAVELPNLGSGCKTRCQRVIGKVTDHVEGFFFTGPTTPDNLSQPVALHGKCISDRDESSLSSQTFRDILPSGGDG